MSGRLTPKQFEGLKIDDKVLYVAGMDPLRVVAYATIVGNPESSIRIRLDHVHFAGIRAVAENGLEIDAARSELYHQSTKHCVECGGRGIARYGREGQGYDDICRRCHGDGVEN